MAGGDGDGLAREGPDGVLVDPTRGRRLHVPHEGDRRAEQPGLHGRLVAADAAELVRTVGAEHDHRYTGVVRLEHGGVQVRDGGARGRHDRGGPAALDGEPEGEEPGGALVEPDVHRDPAGPFEGDGGEGEGLRA